MFGDEAQLDAAEQWVNDWQAGIEQRAAKARALSERLSGLTATARSRDGLIEVTVSSSGILTDLWLDDGVRRHSGRWIAEQVLAVTRQALDQLTTQVGTATQDILGSDSPEGRAIIASYTTRLGQALGGGHANT
jgi:hypothetical protein